MIKKFILMTGLLILATASFVQAHSLGQETLSRHSLFVVEPTRLTLYYTLDMAEKPTLEELRRMDKDQDGTTTEAERDQYIFETADLLQKKMQLTANDERLSLEMIDHDLQVSLSGHELPVLNLTYQFEAELPSGSEFQFAYDDQNYSGTLGWQEVVVQSARGVTIQNSTASADDMSDQLTDLPRDLDSNPVQTSAEWAVTAGESVSSNPNHNLPLILIAFGLSILGFAWFSRMVLR